MKHLIMGTAGHIDHGKTALIKMLTGIDCDTHKEEKKRGITINLGFAHIDLPTGENIGIIDVPGHKDFVHTMVGGASGIDFVLLVIAADSGVMPQTREHVQIMEVLGVEHGIIALTKTDLVDDPELLEIVRADIKEFAGDTFLKDFPIVEVSAKTGKGLPQLKEEIVRVIERIEEKSPLGIFRMFIDRVFTVTGFGTVVTGSVISGMLHVKDTVYLLPGGKKELTVRRLERHGKEAEEVKAGDRASLNLVGLDKADFKRGMIIADRVLKETDMLDVRLELFQNSGRFGIWSQVIFHAGTYESQARIHLIDKNNLAAGESGLAQVHLPAACILRHGDRFVIRSSSNDLTLGGGEVIDVAPLHHRRRPDQLIKKMTAIVKGKLPELISSEVKKFFRAVTTEEVAFSLNISAREVEDSVARKLPKDIEKFVVKDKIILISRDRLQGIRRGIFEAVKEFRKQNPLIHRGAALNEIRGSLRIGRGGAGEDVLKEALREQTQKGRLKEKDKTWMLGDETGAIDEKLKTHLVFFADYLKSFKMKTPLLSDLKIQAEKRGLKERDLKQIMYNLTIKGEVYRIKDDYLHASIVNNCREKLVKELSGREGGITVAQFRDLVGGNRKICLLLLAQYDAEMVTRRDGDYRYLAPTRVGHATHAPS